MRRNNTGLSKVLTAAGGLSSLVLFGLVVAPETSGPALAGAPQERRARKDKKQKPRRSIINEAYVKIKDRRRKALDKYVSSVQEIIETCAEEALRETGIILLDRLDAVIERPQTRRKIQIATGVGLDEEGERVILGRRGLRRVKKKKVDDGLEDARKWAREMRQKLSGKDAKEDGGTGELKPLDLESDEDDGEAGPKKPGRTRPVGPGEAGGSKSGRAGRASTKKGGGDGSAGRNLLGKERSARRKFIRSVETVAKSAAKQGFPAHAYELLLWALRVDPDNRALRRTVRQYRYVDDDDRVRWLSPWEMRKAKAGYKEHPEFGWVTPAQLKALKAGKVWYKGRWMERDFVERERQKWDNAWVYPTEHFEITTNAPLRDAVEFGREVERLYSFFFRQFVDFYSTGRPDPDLVFGGGMDLGSKKLKLHYYRSREHYLKNIQADPVLTRVPNFALTLRSAGFYYPGNGKAYFYRGPNGPDLSVIYHEVTHQIFGETSTRGPRPPVWMVEGLAVFMEDPVIRGERLLAGTEPPPGIRQSDFRDINDFVKNAQDDRGFHGEGRGDNYATAGAVVHFFLLYKGGIYRRGFVKYAREAYRNTGVDQPTPVEKLYEYLGVTKEKLQSDWEEFNQDPDLFDF